MNLTRADEPEKDRTGAPYLLIQGSSLEREQFPLISNAAEVEIVGPIAEVKITQVYQNTHPKPLEALYVFPVSTRAAVHGLEMRIGERVITAKIDKRQEARNAYETAKSAGQTTSLLEQQRPNVFQMNVANILPGEEIRITLNYSEMIIPKKGVYQFVYPTVVGPRYVSEGELAEAKTETWTPNPYLPQGARPVTTFDIKTRIASGIPLKEIRSPSHQLDITYDSQSEARISLARTGEDRGNRD